MGTMNDLREELKAVPGIRGLSMNYEDGGKVQAFKLGEIVVRVGASASLDEIKLAILKAVEERDKDSEKS